MRRFLPTLFILLALVIGTVGAALTAHATETCPSDHPTQDFQDGLCYNFDADGNPTDAGVVPIVTEDSLTNTADAAAAIGEGNAKPATPKSSLDDAYDSVMMKIMGLFAWLVGVAALTLDYAVYYTVVNMGSYIKQLSAIGVTWQILRDIGNIMLIFGFLAVGITTILNVDWYGGGKKMLPMMLIAAVFLNFSLFISEAIIDTGNLFATQFYTQINGNSAALAPSAPGNWADLSNLGQQGIAGKIMNTLGLQTIYGNGTTNPAIFKPGTPWYIGFMGILLFIVTAFVLFSLAFVLIARFVALIFLIILAPIGFAGLAVPQLKARATKWWDTLFEQTITAPILLLMLYIALRVITDVQFLRGFNVATLAGGASTGFVENSAIPAFAGFILSFIVAMGLLIAVVIQSKNLSAFGAAGASKLAGKLTFGLTAAGMRSSAGWGLQGASQAIRRSRIGGTKTGRLLATTFDKGAKGSFDIRGATAFGGLKAIGIDAGKAQEGGYRARQENTIKGHQEYIKTVGTAIDEQGVTKADSLKVEEMKKAAAAEHALAKNEQQALEQQVNQEKTEVQKIEEEKKRDRYWDTDPKNEQRLKDAQQKLTTSETSLTAANVKLTKAAADLSDAEGKTAEDIGKKRIAGEKKTAQLDYAENISNSPFGLAMFGPGGAMAAKKIIKDASKTKSEKDEVFDLIKKAMEKEKGSEKPPAPTPAPPSSK